MEVSEDSGSSNANVMRAFRVELAYCGTAIELLKTANMTSMAGLKNIRSG